MRMKNLTKLFILCVVCLTTFKATAQDRYLAYTMQSNVIPKGTRQLEVWYANKSGGYSYFNGNYMRTGFKVGLGKNLTTTYYINVSGEAYVGSEINHTDKVTREYDQFLTKESDISFSADVKYKILDPVANPIGLAIHADITVGGNYYIFSPRIIIDKRFGNNFIAFNAWVAAHSEFDVANPSSEVSTTKPEMSKFSEPPIEMELAYMRFTKNQKFGFGAELRIHSEATDFAGWEHLAIFGGPAIHARGDKWFFSASAMPQLGNLHKSWIAPDSKVLDEHQNFELRTAVGFVF
jgi:hypothetical protein